MTRYKNPQLQALYENMLRLAEDKASELYWEGAPRRGAGHRAAFWDGFSGKFDFTGPKRSAHVIPGTLSAVCFMAGQEFARRQKKDSRLQSRHISGMKERKGTMSVDVDRLFVDTDYMNRVLAETAILMIKNLPTFEQFCNPDDLAFAFVPGSVLEASEQYLNHVQIRMQQALDLLKGREAFLVLVKTPTPV